MLLPLICDWLNTSSLQDLFGPSERTRWVGDSSSSSSSSSSFSFSFKRGRDTACHVHLFVCQRLHMRKHTCPNILTGIIQEGYLRTLFSRNKLNGPKRLFLNNPHNVESPTTKRYRTDSYTVILFLHPLHPRIIILLIFIYYENLHGSKL